MLENNPVLWEGGEEPEWRGELQVMLMLNVDAEMEVLADREGGVLGWVEGKLLERQGSESATMADDLDAMTLVSSNDDDLDR